MKKEICCKKCDTVIANDDGTCLVPVKSRMRYNYKEKLSTVLCHTCNFLNYFDGNTVVEDSEKRNARHILDSAREFLKKDKFGRYVNAPNYKEGLL